MERGKLLALSVNPRSADRVLKEPDKKGEKLFDSMA
jgi:hypothetical protein